MICIFAVSLDSYGEYLDSANVKPQNRQSMMNPLRQVDTNTSVLHIGKAPEVFHRYAKLDLALSEMSCFEPLYFDETTLGPENKSSSTRFKFLNHVTLSVNVHILKYDPGAGLGTLVFIWKVPDDMSSEDIFLIDNQVIHKLRPKLPEYRTRKMSFMLCMNNL
jgi:hypothetical protein